MHTVASDTLLAGLKDPANETLWRDYVDRYRPMLVQWGRRAGLADADADDLAQEVLLAFAEAYRKGGYDRAKGRLRAWLFGIARVCASNHLRRRRRGRGWSRRPSRPSPCSRARGCRPRRWPNAWG